MRGYFGIGIWYPNKEINCGTLFRSAYAFGADFIYTIGRKYRKESSDTCSTTKHVPYYHYKDVDDFTSHLPKDCRLTIVEIADKAYSLPKFNHFERSCYLLGNEGGGIPQQLLEKHSVVKIPSSICLNVAVAGSIVLYDRISKIGV